MKIFKPFMFGILPKSVSNSRLYLALLILSVLVSAILFGIEKWLDYRFAKDAEAFELKLPPRASHESYSQSVIDNGIPTTRYNSDLGNLPNDEINLIYQDSFGIIWAGTDFGLCYFDGKKFKSIEVVQSFDGFVPNARPTALLGDGKGRLYVYFSQIGLCVYDFNTKTIRLLHKALSDDQRIPQTNLIIANNNLYFSDDKSYSIVRMLDIRTSKVYELSNRMYGLFVKGKIKNSIGYYTYETGKERCKYIEYVDTILIKDISLPRISPEFTYNINGDSVAIFSRDINYFYIHDRKSDSITKCDLPIYKDNSGRGIGSILNLHYDRKNEDFIFSGWGGICIFNHRNMKYTFYHNRLAENNNFSSFDTPVTSCIIDNIGNIWLGGYFSGITKIELSNAMFQNFNLNLVEDSKVGIINDVIESKEGELLLATKSGLLLTDTNFVSIYLLKDTNNTYAGCNKNWLTNILPIDDNSFVINSWGGYPIKLEKEGNSWQLKRKDFRRNISAACGIFCNKSFKIGNKIIYSSWGMGDPLVLTDETVDSIWFYTRDNQSKPIGISNLLSTLYLDSNYLWLGYSDKGIQLFELENGKINTNIKDDTIYIDMQNVELESDPNNSNLIKSSYISQFFKLSNGILFALSTSGLYSIEDKYIKEHRIIGLESKQIKVVKQNPYNGDVWVGTTNGLYLASKDLGYVIKRYDTRYGLNTPSINGLYFTQNGRLLVTTKKGISILRDRYFVKDQPIVIVNKLFNNNTIIIPKKGLYKFQSRDPLLRVDCLSNLNQSESNLSIRFKVPGTIPKWTMTESGSEIYFTLKAGRHKVLLQAASLNGEWNNPINTLFVKVPCSWYATIWFKSLVVLMIGLFLFIYYNEKVSQRRKERELKEVVQYLRLQTIHAQMNPHFIFNMLGTVQYYILKKEPLQANKLILKLSRLIRNYLDSSVKSSRAESGLSQLENTLRQELELIKDYMDFERIQANNNFEFDIYIDPNIDLDITTIPPMLLQPFLENAVKHGISYLHQGGLIELKIEAVDDNIRFIIRDNGVGRSESKRRQEESLRSYKSYGTELVMKKVEMLREMGYFIELYTKDLDEGFEVTILIQQ